MKWIGLLGRVLFGAIFVVAFPNHLRETTVSHAAEHGVPFAAVTVPLSGVIALLGGLSIAVGYRAKWGAWLIVLFLVPVTVTMHRFWGLSDPKAATMQQIMFMKNVALLGAVLLFTQVGPGPMSVDARSTQRGARVDASSPRRS